MDRAGSRAARVDRASRRKRNVNVSLSRIFCGRATEVCEERRGGSDPTNEQRDDSRYVVVELLAFEGTCRVTFKDNAAIGILFAIRPGHYTATIEDDKLSLSHTVAFTTRGESELYSLVFLEERIAPIERGSVVVSDGKRQEIIPLD
jgi:hypothetical protein